MGNNGEPSQDVHFRDVAPAIECVCWLVVVIAAGLRMVNGAPVTYDQLLVQVTLFTVALGGAIGLGIYRLLRK
jgi:hypothetical protein